MKTAILIIDTQEETIRKLAAKIYMKSISMEFGYFHLAISGGSSPLKLFRHLASHYGHTMLWNQFKVFWVDERCVPPDESESNYGMAHKYLLKYVSIPENQIFRMMGENKPEEEASRYETILRENLPEEKGFPRFDFIILGMGTDGHFASIFSDQMHLLNSEKACESSVHPGSGQNRITLTGKVINNAKYIASLVTGESKALAIKEVIGNNNRQLPATHIAPTNGTLEWYLDAAAAKLLNT